MSSMEKRDYKILIVDDEIGIREGLKKTLSLEGFYVESEDNGKSAVKLLKRKVFNLAFIDLHLPDITGVDVIDQIDSEQTEIIIITAYATVETAVQAMKKGASDYIRKPFDISEAKDLVNKYYLKYTTSKNLNISKKINGPIILKSNDMTEIYGIIDKIKDSTISVLILGESGTGKEMIARLIHSEGNRKRKPFIGINCAAIPADLLESELFGFEKGSFSGASKNKKGKFELAEDGIIFLDEIGDMTYVLQSKILRVLEERNFERVGGISPIPLKARIIASTNIKIMEAIEKERFRSDLYYRLNGAKICIPSLKERTEDIEQLVYSFIEHFNALYGKKVSISQEGLSYLKKKCWPGNIRELKSVIEYAVLLSESDTVFFSKDFPLDNEKNDGSHSLFKIEKEKILKALDDNGFNRSLTAKTLSISRKTLYNKMKKHSLI